jgi:hypothetical protein
LICHVYRWKNLTPLVCSIIQGVDLEQMASIWIPHENTAICLTERINSITFLSENCYPKKTGRPAVSKMEYLSVDHIARSAAIQKVPVTERHNAFPPGRGGQSIAGSVMFQQVPYFFLQFTLKSRSRAARGSSSIKSPGLGAKHAPDNTQLFSPGRSGDAPFTEP